MLLLSGLITVYSFTTQTKWIIQQDKRCAWWACTRMQLCQERVYQYCRFCLQPINIYKHNTRFQHAQDCSPWTTCPRRTLSTLWCKSHICYHYPSFILRHKDDVNHKLQFRKCEIEKTSQRVEPKCVRLLS